MINVILKMVYGCLTMGILSILVLWVFPRKWIVWSEVVDKILPRGGPPTWKTANLLGKTAWVIFYSSGLMLLTTLTIGVLIEKSSQ